MSLVSIISADAAAAAVVNPILYDSGWKTVAGNSMATDLETLSYTSDAMVHVYAKAYKNTNLSYYSVKGVYSGTGGSATDNFYGTWTSTSTKGGSTTSSTYPYDVRELSNSSPIASQSAEARNSPGIALEKNTTFLFHQNSSASTSYGIQYRVVVERSDGEHMIKWATNA